MVPKSAAPLASTLTLPSDREILIERAFKAPRQLVWGAFTDAKLLPRWMGPAQYKMTTSEMDVRPGGAFRWAWRIGDGELAISGRFLEVDPPKRIVTTENMSDMPDAPGSHNTTTFTERHGWTTVSILIKMPDKASRDTMLATGMKEGMDEGYLRLDALVEELQ